MRNAIVACLSLLCLADPVNGEPPTMTEVTARMRPYDGGSFQGVDPNTLVGKVMCGYLVVELPLILLLVAGIGKFLEASGTRVGIGLAGGAFLLLLMGGQLLLSLRATDNAPASSTQRHPFWSGVVLTAANPYFLLWWATVGLTMAGQAMEFGLLVLGLFALVHWLCDLIWLEVLSLVGFKGTEAFGQRSQKIVSAVCGVLLLGFGLKFVWDAGVTIAG